MSKSKSTTTQREYFRAMLRRNESTRNGRRMEAVYAAWYEGAIWPRIADPYGLYGGSEQFFEAVPLMRTISRDGDTYRVYLASLAPERYEYGGSADRVNRMWADLEAEATAGRVRPLKLTRYLADVRESGTPRLVPARVLRSPSDGAEVWIPTERLGLVHVDLGALMGGYRFEQATDKDAGRGAVRVIEAGLYRTGSGQTVAWIMPLDRGHQAMEQPA